MDKGGAGGVTDWIGAAEAAQRLGIKQASLYSYVSRGIQPVFLREPGHPVPADRPGRPG